jgi:Gamma tubulin complex component C-terminal
MTKGLNVRAGLATSYCLRQRMLHFLQNFVYYMTLEVIGPRGNDMQEGMSVAEDMDEVINLHEKFLDTCLKECLLASQELLKILTKIMTTCLLFTEQMHRFALESEGYNYDDHTFSRKNSVSREEFESEQETYINYETSHEVYKNTIKKFEDTFDEQVRTDVVMLWHFTRLMLILFIVKCSWENFLRNFGRIQTGTKLS